MRPDLLIPAITGLVGLLLGSFLNVCIARIPNDESIASPRSRCPHCGQEICWYDNIPLVSYALLRARCRDCDQSISWRYPAVELATAAWFLLCARPVTHSLGLAMDPLLQVVVLQASLCILGWLLIGLAVIDWTEQILPDVLTVPGILAGLLFACAQAALLDDTQGNVILKRRININSANAGRSPGNIFLTGAEHLILSRLFAAIAAFLLLYLIRVTYRALRKRDGMGLGDAKLLALIAAFIGFSSSVVALFSAVMLASLYAIPLLARRKASATTRLPFGSFLAAGGLIAAIYGETIANRYLALFP